MSKSKTIQSKSQAVRVTVEQDGITGPNAAVITISERQPHGRYKVVESVFIPEDCVAAVCDALGVTRKLRKAAREAIDLAEEANGDPSSCSYIVPIGDRLIELRKEIS